MEAQKRKENIEKRCRAIIKMVKDANTPDSRSFEEIELESKMKEVKELREQLSKRDELIDMQEELINDLLNGYPTPTSLTFKELRAKINKLKEEL